MRIDSEKQEKQVAIPPDHLTVAKEKRRLQKLSKISETSVRLSSGEREFVVTPVGQAEALVESKLVVDSLDIHTAVEQEVVQEPLESVYSTNSTITDFLMTNAEEDEEGEDSFTFHEIPAVRDFHASLGNLSREDSVKSTSTNTSVVTVIQQNLSRNNSSKASSTHTVVHKLHAITDGDNQEIREEVIEEVVEVDHDRVQVTDSLEPHSNYKKDSGYGSQGQLKDVQNVRRSLAIDQRFADV